MAEHQTANPDRLKPFNPHGVRKRLNHVDILADVANNLFVKKSCDRLGCSASVVRSQTAPESRLRSLQHQAD